MKITSFFVLVIVLYFFCSLALTMHKTQFKVQCIEMQMSNLPVKTFGLTRRTKQCARSRFVQHKTKQSSLFTLSEKLLSFQTNQLYQLMVKLKSDDTRHYLNLFTLFTP